MMNTFNQGRGVWKFNCSLLKHPEYLKIINEAIMTVKTQYAISVYNAEYLDSTPDSDIKFTITDKIFLETLLLKLRGESIKFASKIKKERQTKEVLFTAEIEQLEKSESARNTEILWVKHEELKQLRESYMHGQMIRSRVQNLSSFKKTSKRIL